MTSSDSIDILGRRKLHDSLILHVVLYIVYTPKNNNNTKLMTQASEEPNAAGILHRH